MAFHMTQSSNIRLHIKHISKHLAYFEACGMFNCLNVSNEMISHECYVHVTPASLGIFVECLKWLHFAGLVSYNAPWQIRKGETDTSTASHIQWSFWTLSKRICSSVWYIVQITYQLDIWNQKRCACTVPELFVISILRQDFRQHHRTCSQQPLFWPQNFWRVSGCVEYAIHASHNHRGYNIRNNNELHSPSNPSKRT